MEIIAHRGASHDAPENTLAAARLAWAQGADALECDVHLTRDGGLVVIHDEDTQRVAGRVLLVGDSTVSELRRLDVGSWKHDAFAGEKIPTLEELLTAVPAGKRLFVEIKSGPETVNALAGCVARTALAPSQLVAISFNFDAVRAAKKMLPHSEAYWIIERDSDAGRLPMVDIVARVRAAGLDGLDLEATWPIDSAWRQKMHLFGLKVFVWTVDDASRASDLAAFGVDGITTNRPGWLRGQLSMQAGR